MLDVCHRECYYHIRTDVRKTLKGSEMYDI